MFAVTHAVVRRARDRCGLPDMLLARACAVTTTVSSCPPSYHIQRSTFHRAALPTRSSVRAPKTGCGNSTPRAAR